MRSKNIGNRTQDSLAISRRCGSSVHTQDTRAFKGNTIRTVGVITSPCTAKLQTNSADTVGRIQKAVINLLRILSLVLNNKDLLPTFEMIKTVTYTSHRPVTDQTVWSHVTLQISSTKQSHAAADMKYNLVFPVTTTVKSCLTVLTDQWGWSEHRRI